MNTSYIVGLILSPTVTKYAATDSSSGSYPYWSDSLHSAAMFKTKVAAEKFFDTARVYSNHYNG